MHRNSSITACWQSSRPRPRFTFNSESKYLMVALSLLQKLPLSLQKLPLSLTVTLCLLQKSKMTWHDCARYISSSPSCQQAIATRSPLFSTSSMLSSHIPQTRLTQMEKRYVELARESYDLTQQLTQQLMHCNTFKQDNYSTVGGDGGCRVGKVRAGTTSPMRDHKGFMLQ